MKKIKIFYWIATGLFAAFMAFTAIPDVVMNPDAVTFIGVAKLLGVIAILVPGYPKIKEWAYAGFAFDLIGATYSQIATDGFQPAVGFMILPFALLILSYSFYHKKLRAISDNTENMVPAMQ